MLKSQMSPYNTRLPDRKVIICDTTMREGEQSAGVSFTLQEKMKLTRMLDDMGIQQIQFYPGATADSKGVIREISRMNLHANIVINSVCFENWKENIDFSLSCGTDVAHLSFFSSPLCAHAWDDHAPEQILKVIDESVRYARSQSDIPIETSFIDATRADERFLFRQIETALEAGSNRIYLPDTVGVANPSAIRCLVEKTARIAKAYGSIVGVHAHNDFGLALANALSGFEAGATVIDVSVNGLGDRAGNVALAEAAVALEAMYGVDTGIDLKGLIPVSQYVAKIAARPIPVNLPLVGAQVFSNQDDFHVMAQSRNPFAYRGILASDIGAEEKIYFGKSTGPHVVNLMAQKMGRQISSDDTTAICTALHKMADLKKGTALDESAFFEAVETVDAQKAEIGK